MARVVRPGRVAPSSAVFDLRNGANPSIEPPIMVNGDLSLNHQTVGRPRGFNALPRRLELSWWPGRTQGAMLPQLSAVTQAPAADTYNTANFLANQKADHFFEILGSGAASTDVTWNAEGGINMASHGAGTSATILVPHLVSNQSPWTVYTWGSDQETTWECDIITGASIANAVIYWAGLKLTNTATLATDNDQAYFSFTAANSSGQWECNYSIGNVDVTVASGITVAINTRYHLKIVIDDARIPYFFITTGLTTQPRLVATGTALTDATDFIPYIGIQEGSAAAKTLRVLGQSISRNYA